MVAREDHESVDSASLAAAVQYNSWQSSASGGAQIPLAYFLNKVYYHNFNRTAKEDQIDQVERKTEKRRHVGNKLSVASMNSSSNGGGSNTFSSVARNSESTDLELR